jgi:hypothetical protein
MAADAAADDNDVQPSTRCTRIDARAPPAQRSRLLQR